MLLFDEDVCATNFMIRDPVMRELVKKEPISPLIEKVCLNRVCPDDRYVNYTRVKAFLQFSLLEGVLIISLRIAYC